MRVAWWYLSHRPFADVRQRFGDALRRFAASKGEAERYHETITVAYLLVIAHRIQETPALTWSVFADAHADPLSRTPSILARYSPFAIDSVMPLSIDVMKRFGIAPPIVVSSKL